MENIPGVLKAIANDTRLKIVKLLLQHNYCVGALAHHLELTEAAISQHLKVLREAGLIIGEKYGYFMHYNVNREQLLALASIFEELATIQREVYRPKDKHCGKRRGNIHGHCKCHES